MEIKKSSLIKYSLIAFIQLFILLTFIELNFEAPTYEIEEISLKELNKNIIIIAKVEKQSIINNNLFITLKSENKNKIKGVAFNVNESLSEDIYYKITGKITYYKNELEIIITKIELN